MHVRQLELFKAELGFRAWCGHVWMVLIWRSFDGQYLGEYVLEKVQ